MAAAAEAAAAAAEARAADAERKATTWAERCTLAHTVIKTVRGSLPTVSLSCESLAR